jgi:oligopeptide/dipeptide ABC transporter ATP-binding protein
MTAAGDTTRPPRGGRDEVILAVRDLGKYFPIREGALQKVVGHIKAVDGVSFDIAPGETVGLVGESGCGKTTLGRCVAGLSEPTNGGVYFGLETATKERLDSLLSVTERTASQESELEQLDIGHRVDRMNGDAWRRYRRNCQVVFQESFASLNPRQLVKDIVGRPLRVHREASGSQLTERVVELLAQVGLGRQHLYRFPHQFSGGQRQRISIARALALDPELVILDEPTSALDVSVQAQILNLLHELQQERHLAYLFITHDLSVVRHMADRIVVMYVGRVAEAGPTEVIFDRPQHPYTEALLASSPDVDTHTVDLQALEGAIPDPALPPQGCRFHTRCAVATPICGWEVDDVVRWLEDVEGTFDTLRGVTRTSPFDAWLSFEDEAAAASLAATLRSEAIPEAMRTALEELTVDGGRVRVRFTPVDEVQLTVRGSEHVAACVLDRA